LAEADLLAVMADEDTGPKFHKAKLDDEFLRHPHSRAQIRNPLLEKNTGPVLFQVSEFDYNCLEEVMGDYHTIKVSEKALRELTEGSPKATAGEIPPADPAVATATSTSSTSSSTMKSTLQRAALGRLRDLPAGYEFQVVLRKSTYVPPRLRRRPIETKTSSGIVIDKVNVEVTNLGDKGLRVEDIREGLTMVWNRNNPMLRILPGDILVRVNDKKEASAMLEECATTECIKLTVRRAPLDQRPVAMSPFEPEPSPPRRRG